MISLSEVLVLGLVLGVRHAFDADHLVAVSTIVSEYRKPIAGYPGAHHDSASGGRRAIASQPAGK